MWPTYSGCRHADGHGAENGKILESRTIRAERLRHGRSIKEDRNVGGIRGLPRRKR